MSLGEGFERMLDGRQNKRPSQPVVFYQGTVERIVSGRAIVRLPKYDPDKAIGPMPFLKTVEPPVPGDIALVIFAGQGIADPWMISWSKP